MIVVNSVPSNNVYILAVSKPWTATNWKPQSPVTTPPQKIFPVGKQYFFYSDLVYMVNVH